MKHNKKSGFTLIELLVCLAILTVVSIILFNVTAHGFSKSIGVRSGILQKISYSGLLHNSYEGELLLGGVNANFQDYAAGRVWSFSVLDTNVAAQLNSLIGKPVVLHYHSKDLFNPFYHNNPGVVDEVDTNQ